MKRNTKLIIIIAIFIIPTVMFFGIQKIAIKVQENKSQAVLATVKNIQEKAQAIDLERGYETKILNNEKFLSHMTDGGGQLTGYFKDGKIIKMVEKLGLSYGVVTYEYYFSREDLILVKEQEEDFLDPENNGTLDYTKVKLAFHGEYYFDNKKIINSQVSGKKKFSNEISEDMDKFVKMSQENVALLTAKQ